MVKILLPTPNTCPSFLNSIAVDATELAKQKHDLILVSNQEKEIVEATQKLSHEYGIKAVGLYRNLATTEAAEELHSYCKENNYDIDILINNAGVFFFNELVSTEMKRIEVMLQLHIITVTKMCRLFGEDMKKKGSTQLDYVDGVFPYYEKKEEEKK